MSRAARLLDLVQALRRRRRAVPAAALAEELGVSLRTIYRDIATLVAQGAPIEGEAGLGYVLRPGFLLPPLMLGEDEVDAVILGMRMVANRSDTGLARAAEDALAKILAVLPPEMEDADLSSGLLAGPKRAGQAQHLDMIRQALRDERKLCLRYADKTGRATERRVWPVALGFFAEAEVLAAWCELRQAFRHFRLDRIAEARALDERLPRRRRLLLAEWRLAEGVEGAR
ncbi:MAG: YafY family protein [Roseomonas sp.]|nr:YafY family protein [Roseomonas sp.]